MRHTELPYESDTQSGYQYSVSNRTSNLVIKIAMMKRNNMIISLVILATVVCVHGFVCPLDTCAMVKCEGITASSCADNDQVLMPYAGVCGCCPACVKKIRKGETCAGFLQLLSVPDGGGCEKGTLCKKIADDTFVCD